MKKLLLTTALFATPVMAEHHILKSIDTNYTNEVNKDGDIEKRNTKDFKASFHFGDVKTSGRLSVTAIRRNEIRRKNLDLGKIKGDEKANTIAFTYTKVQPSWGFWGTTVGYGSGDNKLDLDWGLTSGQNFVYDAITNTAHAVFADSGNSLGNRYATALATDTTNGNTIARDTLKSAVTGAIKTASLASNDNEAGALYDSIIAQGSAISAAMKGTTNALNQSKTDTRANKVQKGSSTSTLLFASVFVGTKFDVKGFDIIPMAKFTYQKKTLKDFSLTAANSPATPFALASGKELATDLSVTATREVLGGTMNVNTGLTYDSGTDIAYSITHGAGTKIVLDNPDNKVGYSAGIGYTYPITEKLSAKATFDYYKNGKSKVTTTYVNVGYMF